MSEGGKTAIVASDEVVSVAEVKALNKRIRQLEQNTGSGSPQRCCSHWLRKKTHFVATLVRRGGFL